MNERPFQLRWQPTVFAMLVFGLHAYFLWAAISHRTYLTDDSIQYLTIAENMVESGSFSQSYAAPLVPDVQRTPGYPLFLVILGRDPITVIIVQHVLVLLAGGLIYLLGKRLYSRRIALAGARLYLLQPYPVVMASYILSESLFIFLLVAAAWAYVRFWKGDGWRWVAGAMALLSLATLVRPVALPLVVLGSLLAVAQAWRVPQHRLAHGLLAVCVPALLLAPWIVRNQQVAGVRSLSTMGAMGMLHGRLGGLEAWRQGLTADEHNLYMAGDSIVALELGLGQIRHFPAAKQTHETEQLASGMGRRTIAFFWAHPWDAIRFQSSSVWQMLKGLGHGWTEALTLSWLAAGFFAVVQGLMNLAMYLGTGLAVIRRREWGGAEKILFATILLVLLTSAAAWADGRYRMVIDPFLVVLVMFVLQRQARQDDSPAVAAATVHAEDGNSAHPTRS